MNGRDNQEWAIQGHRQHLAYNTEKGVNSNPGSWRDVLDTTLCDKVCQWLATGRCCFPGNPVSSTNKTNRHHITEILLKVAFWHSPW
jgi:hypothetical protein